MTREELTIEIEKYLDGQLSADEAKKLELLIIADDKVAKEIEMHQSLRKGIQAYHERLQLKNKMQQWENDKSFPVQAKRRNSLWRPVMAAASISLIVTIGGVSLYHYTFTNKIDNKLEGDITKLAGVLDNYVKTNNKKITEVFAKVNTPQKENTNINNVIGTGFMLTGDGYMVTNYHLVKDALKYKRQVSVEQQWGDQTVSFNADIVSHDENLDFALLKINDKMFKEYPKVPYSISDKNVTLAQKIYTMGYPKNDIVYSEGAISSLSGYRSDTMFYQLNIISAPGQSGSPIINEKGELVGLLSSKNKHAEGETYCVKMKYILDHIEKIKKENKDLNIKTNQKSKLSGKKLPEQVKDVMGYVFIVKA